jgi:integrase
MPRVVSKGLTPLQVKHAGPGRHVDGDGLHLLVKQSGARSWVLRYTITGKSRDLGLSRCPEAIVMLNKTGERDLRLAQARDVAAIYRMKVKAGIDPLEERKLLAEHATAAQVETARKSATFFQVASDYLTRQESGWRNSKHRQQWYNTLATYAHPKIGEMLVADIDLPAILKVLEPLWQQKPETASRLRGRIEAILDAAKVRGLRSGENPARWRGHLDKVLPPRSRLTRGHHTAMSYSDMPAFMAELKERKAIAALALEFTILTAARTGETIGAKRGEVDIDRAIWTIPAARMKAGREHRVPLSTRAVEILRTLENVEGDFLFPGERKGGLSNMAMSMLLKRMNRGVTVHGFRSAFRDWASECTGYPHEVCEMALAHTISNKAEAAYRRRDLFEKRHLLMQEWANHCAPTNNLS